MLLEEGHQHHADDIREQFAALRLGQRRHTVDDGRGGAKDEALDLGRVQRAGMRLKASSLSQPWC